jgi:hypothetical protein
MALCKTCNIFIAAVSNPALNKNTIAMRIGQDAYITGGFTKTLRLIS